ncbi:hypothetical protein QBC35DRAFT_453541 [Podospora australis]|uniref:Uncharacterized protein n=1 Tax=Podospora australis TaxID=1536484 RepID=A0AAN6WQK3_9PEZI|nr:hypothetical protein QBC35DRAFT_453541 [Podospora australis]
MKPPEHEPIKSQAIGKGGSRLTPQLAPVAREDEPGEASGSATPPSQRLHNRLSKNHVQQRQHYGGISISTRIEDDNKGGDRPGRVFLAGPSQYQPKQQQQRDLETQGAIVSQPPDHDGAHNVKLRGVDKEIPGKGKQAMGKLGFRRRTITAMKNGLRKLTCSKTRQDKGKMPEVSTAGNIEDIARTALVSRTQNELSTCNTSPFVSQQQVNSQAGGRLQHKSSPFNLATVQESSALPLTNFQLSYTPTGHSAHPHNLAKALGVFPSSNTTPEIILSPTPIADTYTHEEDWTRVQAAKATTQGIAGPHNHIQQPLIPERFSSRWRPRPYKSASFRGRACSVCGSLDSRTSWNPFDLPGPPKQTLMSDMKQILRSSSSRLASTDGLGSIMSSRVNTPLPSTPAMTKRCQQQLTCITTTPKSQIPTLIRPPLTSASQKEISAPPGTSNSGRSSNTQDESTISGLTPVGTSSTVTRGSTMANTMTTTPELGPTKSEDRDQGITEIGMDRRTNESPTRRGKENGAKEVWWIGKDGQQQAKQPQQPECHKKGRENEDHTGPSYMRKTLSQVAKQKPKPSRYR